MLQHTWTGTIRQQLGVANITNAGVNAEPVRKRWLVINSNKMQTSGISITGSPERK
jgi:hypothetical protein